MGNITFPLARLLCAAMVTMLAAIACGSGTVLGSSGATSGGASGSGGTSGTSDASDVDTGTCAEFHIGGQNDPAVAATPRAQVVAQSIADSAGASASQIDALAAACKKVAVGLGALDASLDAGTPSPDDLPDPRGREEEWCGLALGAVMNPNAGIFRIAPSGAPSAAPACKLSVAQKVACQARCAAGQTCDPNTNPVVCTGGTLSGGFCVGGKLEGGCQVDPACNAACDVSVAAAATCLTPVVTVTTLTANDAAAAAQFVAVLEADLPALYALGAHFQAERAFAVTAYGLQQEGSQNVLDEVNGACLAPIVNAEGVATQDLMNGFLGAYRIINR